MPTGAGDRAIRLAELAGLSLFPWQQFALRMMLGERADGKWSAFESCLLVPRQNGKGSVIEAYELANLFLFDSKLIIHSAHLFPTAQEAFRRLDGLIQDCPTLKAKVHKVSNSHGSEGIELKSGSRIRFMARTVSGSGRGFSPDRLVLDEAFRLPPEAVAAMLPALSAQPNPQILYTSSTGYPDSDVLLRLLERGRSGDDASLAFMDWSADPQMSMDDPEAWAMANPSLGYLFDEETIARERATLSDEAFGRERLGIWDESATAAVIDMAHWASCADPDSAPDDPYSSVFAIDMAPDRSSATIALGSKRKDGLEHVEIVDNRPGVGWVPDRMQELHDQWVPSAVVVDAGSPAGALIAALAERGVETVNPSTREAAQACGMLFDSVQNGTVRHRNDELLNQALLAAKKRTVGDAWMWDRRDLTDISPLVAATLALWGSAVHGQSAVPNIW